MYFVCWDLRGEIIFPSKVMIFCLMRHWNVSAGLRLLHLWLCVAVLSWLFVIISCGSQHNLYNFTLLLLFFICDFNYSDIIVIVIKVGEKKREPEEIKV